MEDETKNEAAASAHGPKRGRTRRSPARTGPRPRGDASGDLVARLGELALATRLRRLSERLFRDVGRVYRELDVSFEPRWFPLLQALLPGEPRGVTELARSLGWTHPAVNQIAAQMARADLLHAGTDLEDRRRRLLRLSARGRQLGEQLAPVWDEIRAANAELLEELRGDGVDLIASIAAAERALEARDMHERITGRLRRRRASEKAIPTERLEILPYRPAWRRHFESLNREWLERRFTVEPADAALLADPYGRIVKPGGAVYFARLDDRVIGTGALVRHAPGVFEIAKMAVTGKCQRRGVGGRLAQALLQEARARGAATVFLRTSPRLIAARRWYARLGFRPAEQPPSGVAPYRRRSIVMVFVPPDPPRTEESQP